MTGNHKTYSLAYSHIVRQHSVVHRRHRVTFVVEVKPQKLTTTLLPLAENGMVSLRGSHWREVTLVTEPLESAYKVILQRVVVTPIEVVGSQILVRLSLL